MSTPDGNIIIRLEPELRVRLQKMRQETGLKITELIKIMIIEWENDDRKYKVYRRKQT